MSTSNFVSRSPSLQFLKLGGSLITDKQHAHTTRLEVLKRLAGEIAAAFDRDPGLRLLLGHGSGSFGHVPAKEFATRQGVQGEREWHGFTEVWYQASELNRLVIHALHAEGLPAMAFPPSAMVIAQEAKVLSWDLSPLHSALQAGLLPVVYGDVVFDTRRGGTILSTEDLFDHLARDGRRDGARQRLSSDAAPGRGTHRGTGRAAPLHELAGADPDGFRRVSGHVPGQAPRHR